MPVTPSFRLLGRSLSLTALACSWPFLPSATGAEPPRPAQRVAARVGFLGVPCHPHVEWNDANVGRMKDLGFNTMQLNIAWGEVMAYLSLITIPVLAFYLYLQKAFIASIASTGVKG